jgi:hypothetical protein
MQHFHNLPSRQVSVYSLGVVVHTAVSSKVSQDLAILDSFCVSADDFQRDFSLIVVLAYLSRDVTQASIFL